MSIGIFSLTENSGASDKSVTTAGTATCDVISSLDGMTGVTLFFRFVYGSGGTTARAYVQTSIDQGSTWIDIACALFTTANETWAINLSDTPVTTLYAPTDGALADDTVKDGILGDRLRVKIISTGTYAGSTTLAVRASVR